MPTWLWRSIVGSAAAILAMTAAQWASCRFYVFPTIWPWYAKYSETIEARPADPGAACADIDARTTASMMAVLTTLISLSRKAD